MQRLKNIFQKDSSILVIIIGITLLTFSNLFSVAFLYDDYDFLFYWKQIQDFSNIPSLLLGNTPLHHEGVYRPIRSLFYIISYHFYEHNLLLYHLQELIVYSICIVLLYFITKKLTNNRAIAGLTTGIFGVHPMHIDNVANLTANFDTIGILWFFLAFYLFQRFVDTKQKLFFILSCLSCALAFFTYEITLVLPLLIGLYGYYIKQKKIWRYITIYTLIAVAYFLIRIVFLHIDTRGELFSDGVEKLTRIIQQYASYLITAILPLPISKPTLTSATGLLTFSEAPAQNLFIQKQLVSTTFLVSFVSLVGLLYLTIQNFLKRSFFAFCLLWFFVSLLPIIGIGMQYSPTQLFWNRYAIIASYGICLLLGSSFFKLLVSKQTSPFGRYIKSVAITVFITIFMYYSAITHYNISQWKDQRPVLIKEIMQNNNIAQRNNDLGVIAGSYQRYKEAAIYFNQSLQLQPNNLQAQHNLTTVCHMIKANHQNLPTTCTANRQ
jgi:hypothetical protein